jgi:hypothetical protein
VTPLGITVTRSHLADVIAERARVDVGRHLRARVAEHPLRRLDVESALGMGRGASVGFRSTRRLGMGQTQGVAEIGGTPGVVRLG